MGQIHIHFDHRVWALLIFLKLIFINQWAYKHLFSNQRVIKTLFWLNMAIFAQILLGIRTVVSQRKFITTTLHVTIGPWY